MAEITTLVSNITESFMPTVEKQLSTVTATSGNSFTFLVLPVRLKNN